MLTVSNLSKNYAERQLFNDLSFSTTPKTRIALIGPNGCGKTTVLDAIAYPLSGMMEIPFPKSKMGLGGNAVIRRGAIESPVDFDKGSLFPRRR